MTEDDKEPRVDIHTTIDSQLHREIVKGIKDHRWRNISHALDYCVNFTLKYLNKGRVT
jgi:hypothetical protein